MNDIDNGCYLSADEIWKKIHFCSITKLRTVLGRAEFDKYRKYQGKFCYYKFNDELISELNKYKENRCYIKRTRPLS